MQKGGKDLFKILDWDTKFFGYKVAKINTLHLTSNLLRDLLSKLKSQGVTLVYWFIQPQDKISNKAAEKNSGFLADDKVTCVKNLSNYKSITIDPHLHSYLYKPLNKKLISLALQSGFYSRFARDKNFKNNEFTRLYTKWIEKSIKGKIAKDVIVWVDNNIEKGVITLEKEGNFGKIGLIAVDKKYRQKGIGKQLVYAALTKYKEMGINLVKVSTQKDNVAACKLYEKLGFVEEKVQNVYHFWLNGQKTT